MTPCITRWNSLYDSLNCITGFKEDTIQQLCQELGLPHFETNEIEFLREYCNVLNPLAIAIDKFQEEKTAFMATSFLS